jgi:F0F1-type ATP synthase assembly protein I
MKNNSAPDPDKKPVNNALKYTSLGFQMLATIAISVFAGIKLDEWLHTHQIFTIILSMIGVIGGIYLAIKDFIKPKKK